MRLALVAAACWKNGAGPPKGSWHAQPPAAIRISTLALSPLLLDGSFSMAPAPFPNTTTRVLLPDAAASTDDGSCEGATLMRPRAARSNTGVWPDAGFTPQAHRGHRQKLPLQSKRPLGSLPNHL